MPFFTSQQQLFLIFFLKVYAIKKPRILFNLENLRDFLVSIFSRGVVTKKSNFEHL
jgi:hypothetical protein